MNIMNITDITTYYQNLSKETKSTSFRNSLKLSDFQEVRKTLDGIKLIDASAPVFDALYHIFMFLRNSCVQSKQNQLLIVEADIVNTVKEILTKYLELTVANNFSEELKKLYIASIQFLGNLVVQNKETQIEVWKVCFPSLFFEQMANLENNEKDLLCMVLFNCIKEKGDFLTMDDEFWLALSILEHCQVFHEAEWGMFIVEIIILSKTFPDFYKRLTDYPKHRKFILNIINSYLEEDSSIEIPEFVILFLSDIFITKMQCVLNLAKNITEELIEETSLLYINLQILSLASRCIEKYDKFRSKENLFSNSIKLLRCISSEEYSNFFSKKADIAASNNYEQHPAFQFKKSLIQLMANMLYKNKNLQDVIRKQDGIIPLLNATVLDDKNPYIMQWAVFAIRNLCEGNIENQEYIKKLEKQGLAENSICDGCNIDVSYTDGKIKMKPI